MVPAAALAFVSASAHATPDGLSAQAADEMHCNTVNIIQTSATEFVATGCGRDRTYACEDDGTCASDAEGVTTTSEERAEDDAAAEMVASALTDMACACASAGLAHGSHHAHTSSNATHHDHKKR